jgi:hypothetical protein
MRQIAIALASTAILAASIATIVTPAAAQTYPCGPDDPNVGGLQGRDCQGWNRNWEIGARASARAMARYPQPFNGVPQQRIYAAPQGYSGVPQGYLGGYGGEQIIQGPVARGSITTLVPIGNWRRICFPDGTFRCIEGTCPAAPCGM